MPFKKIMISKKEEQLPLEEQWDIAWDKLSRELQTKGLIK
jgi:hypothetical protein